MMGRYIAYVLVLAWACPIVAHDLAGGDQLFTQLGGGEGYIAQTHRFRAELRPVAGADEFPSWAITLTRASDNTEGYAVVEDSSVYTPDDISLLESFHCGVRHVEVVLRLPPPRTADRAEFSYIRVIFDAKMMQSKVQFFDVSVAALNAVVSSNLFASEAETNLYRVECDSDGLAGIAPT